MPSDLRQTSLEAFVQYQLKQTPRLTFAPDRHARSLLAFQIWQRKVRRKLKALLRFPVLSASQPTPRQIGLASRPGYQLERWECFPEPGSRVSFLVLIPEGVTTTCPAPAVMCFPGTAGNKELLSGEPCEFHVGGRGTESFRYDPNPHASCKAGPPQPIRSETHMALHVVRAGMVAVAVDNPGIGEPHLPGERPVSFELLKSQLIRIGRNYAGLSTFQKKVILEWLRLRDDIIPGRIGVCGHSLGAIPALLLGVLDTRLRAVVWNDGCAYQRERLAMTGFDSDGFKFLPPLITDEFAWFDMPDLMAALAPRPLLISESTCVRAEGVIRKAYTLLGASAHFQTYPHPARQRDQKGFSADPLPEEIPVGAYFQALGLEPAEVSSGHYFKADVAVPWLAKALGTKPSSRPSLH